MQAFLEKRKPEWVRPVIQVVEDQEFRATREMYGFGIPNHAMIDDQSRKRPRPPPMPMANRGTKASSRCSSNRDTTATPTTTKKHGASSTPSNGVPPSGFVYLMGAKRLASNPTASPTLQLNARLEPRTGWNSVPVPGYIPAKAFFACLAAKVPHHHCDSSFGPLGLLARARHLPRCVWTCPCTQTRPSDFLQTYGQAALHATTDQQTEELARLSGSRWSLA